MPNSVPYAGGEIRELKLGPEGLVLGLLDFDGAAGELWLLSQQEHLCQMA